MHVVSVIGAILTVNFAHTQLPYSIVLSAVQSVCGAVYETEESGKCM